MATRRAVEHLSPQEALEELAELAAALAEADRAYYQADAPDLTDADYDLMKRRSAAIEARFPELKRPGRSRLYRLRQRTARIHVDRS
jgi:DNA ligase (NAD+)